MELDFRGDSAGKITSQNETFEEAALHWNRFKQIGALEGNFHCLNHTDIPTYTN